MSASTSPDRRATALFGVIAGLLIGLLVAAVAVPKRQPERIVGARGADTGAAGAVDDFTASGDGGGGRPDDASSVGESAEVAGGRAPAGATGGRAERTRSADGRTSGGAGAGPDAAGGGPVRGVDADSITLGVAYPDIGALRALGPAFDNGDVALQWRALIDGYRRSGRLPIHGRDIELAFRDYNVLAPEEQRAACIGLVKDDGAFLVIAQTYYLVGAECVAREFRTPLITSDGPSDPIFERSAPYLFSLQMSEDRVLRNLVAWADERGLLDGKDIGIYYEDTPLYHDQMQRTVKAELRRRGHALAAEATTDQSLGGPQDAVAVQRFQAAGVDVALLFTSKAGFMQQAEAQRYRPTYLESDFLFGTSDSTSSTYPPSQFDGTLALTGRRVGESAVGMPLGPAGDACLANYERFTGERPEVETAEWAYILTGCDLGEALLTALQVVGADLRPERIPAGLETMRSVAMIRYAPVTFTPTKHHGVDSYREVRWAASCECWRVSGPFRPLPAP